VNYIRYRKSIVQFIAIWCFVAVWQICVVSLPIGGFKIAECPLGYVSEIFCFGHVICLLTGDLGYGGGMPFSDWRWITGAVLMLLASILATFPQNRILRISVSLSFAVFFLFGSLGTLANITQHC